MKGVDDIMYILDTIFRDLRTIINTIVIKYDKKGKELDTLDIVRESDRYISAKLAQDSFNTYQSFDIDVIVAAGINDLEFATKCNADKYLIPLTKRNDVVSKQREKVINTYVERNNYYRMLNGLPDIEDFDYIFVDEITCTELSLNPNTPIHEYTKEEIIRLESYGILESIKKEYLTKKYLNYLGPNSIDIVRARSARNFSILRMSQSMSESFYEEFNNIYEQCREYFMSVLYIKEYGKEYDLYDNFMAMMIFIMSIQRLITNTFKYGIERDFYDLGSIEMMFNAYNVPFIAELPIEYQRILLRNLNNLLRYKSTDKVLYDVCTLLGFERIRIFKYYLMKEHALDVNENPLFVYKTIKDEHGNDIVVEDKEQMYRFYFQTVDLKERNVALALTDSTAKLDYNQVTVEDPYWWEDEDLREALYNTEFNYVETKFLNMNIMYKLTEMLFEVIYTFRMLVDKKTEVDRITIQLPKIFDKKEIKLFDLAIFLSALLCKKNKMSGNILHTPSKILSVMGFNFSADMNKVREYIDKNPRLFDRETLKRYLERLNIYNPQDVNAVFTNVKKFNDFIVDKMAKSQNIEEYRAYQQLHKTLMITNETTDLFKKDDGTIAETFLDYLEYRDFDLYTFVTTCDESKISEYIEHGLFKLNELMTTLKYTYILNDSNNALLNAVITLIRFFKSYTTDLSNFNILYLMDSRYYNMIKLINDIHFIDKCNCIKEPMKAIKLKEKLTPKSKIWHNDLEQFKYKVKSVSVDATISDEKHFENVISSINANYKIYSKLMLDYMDTLGIFKTNMVTDRLPMTDKIRLIYEE